jgi:hypothetical protein
MREEESREAKRRARVNEARLHLLLILELLVELSVVYANTFDSL